MEASHSISRVSVNPGDLNYTVFCYLWTILHHVNSNLSLRCSSRSNKITPSPYVGFLTGLHRPAYIVSFSEPLLKWPFEDFRDIFVCTHVVHDFLPILSSVITRYFEDHIISLTAKKLVWANFLRQIVSADLVQCVPFPWLGIEHPVEFTVEKMLTFLILVVNRPLDFSSSVLQTLCCRNYARRTHLSFFKIYSNPVIIQAQIWRATPVQRRGSESLNNCAFSVSKSNVYCFGMSCSYFWAACKPHCTWRLSYQPGEISNYSEHPIRRATIHDDI